MACDRALTRPHSGWYESGCHGCELRAVAQAPRHIREQAYAQLPASDRAAFIAAVAAEYERWSTLKTNPPETATPQGDL